MLSFLSRKVGLLSIQRRRFHIEPIPLKTVRPFKMGEVVLTEEAEDPESGLDLQKRDTITAFLKARVQDLIAQAEEEWREEGREGEMMLPLIRLRVETTGAKELMNAPRFGQQFTGFIANPKDVVQYYRRKTVMRSDKVRADAPDFDELEANEALVGPHGGEAVSKVRMNEIVNTYLAAQTLEVMKPGVLEDALHRYIDKDDTDAIRE